MLPFFLPFGVFLVHGTGRNICIAASHHLHSASSLSAAAANIIGICGEKLSELHVCIAISFLFCLWHRGMGYGWDMGWMGRDMMGWMDGATDLRGLTDWMGGCWLGVLRKSQMPTGHHHKIYACISWAYIQLHI